jgi:hypothetical protein
MANDIEKLVYRRGQRWWLDARTFRDVDGGREPLCEPGRTVATSDRSQALALAKLRIAELASLRLARQTKGIERGMRLKDAAREWLIFLARDTDLENATIASYEWATRWIIILMKENPFLHELTTLQARNLRTAASKAVSKRTRKPLSSRSQRHIVKTLQLIIEWGQTEGVVPSGLDVVAPALRRMRVRNKQTPYFEPVEVAAFLEGMVDTAGSITPAVLLTYIWAMTGVPTHWRPGPPDDRPG